MDSKRSKKAKEIKEVIATLHQIFLNSNDYNIVSEAKHLEGYLDNTEKEFIDKVCVGNR